MRAWARRPRAPCRSCLRQSMASRSASRRCHQGCRRHLRVFREAVTADAGLVGEPWRDRAVAAGRRDRRGAGEESNIVVPDRVARHEREERADYPRPRGATPTRLLVRFTPDARVADITALLDNYQAAIVDGAKGGLFRLQFGNGTMGKNDVAALMSKLQKEKIVSLAVETP